MIEQLKEIDRALFLMLNEFHLPWLDYPVFILTQTYAWIPLYIVLAFIIIQKYKMQSWVFLLGIILTILLTDQITSSMMKPYFERLRPSRDPSLEGLVHTVNGYIGGRYGFASSHAANTFGVATFIFLLFKETKRWIGAIFIWAILVSYTRIYLGVHYPGDIIVGGIIGALCGWLAFRFSFVIRSKFQAQPTNLEN